MKRGCLSLYYGHDSLVEYRGPIGIGWVGGMDTSTRRDIVRDVDDYICRFVLAHFGSIMAPTI